MNAIQALTQQDPLREAYQYEPLLVNERSIRLVELSPELTSDGTVQCELQIVRFDQEPPKYETLSYVWGDASNTAIIRCGGKSFKVTASLQVVLRRLMLPDAPRLLWIDQLCIDQANNDEKTHQVGMMRDIYRQSTRTIAWVGESTEESDLAMKALERTGTASVSGVLETNENWKKLTADKIDYKSLFRGGSNWGSIKTSRSELAAIANLLRRPWFERMWIIQEACVSAVVQVFCGQQEIDLDFLLVGVSLALVPKLGHRPFKMKGYQSLVLLSEIRSLYSDQQLRPLLYLLENTWAFNATDARDKFYALYGLTSTNLATTGLRPDYSLSAEQVYTQSTVALVRSSGRLELLELASNQWEDIGAMPSWVPSFHGDREALWSLTSGGLGTPQLAGKPMIRAMLRESIKVAELDPEAFDDDWFNDQVKQCADELGAVEGDGPVYMPHYAAAADSVVSTLELESGGVLRLSGQLVDKVKETSSVMRSPIPEEGALGFLVDDSTSISDTARYAKRYVRDTFLGVRDFGRVTVERDEMVMGRSKGESYPTGENIRTAYWQTLCAGHRILTEEESEESFRKWRSAMRPLRTLNHLRSHAQVADTPGLGTIVAMMMGRGASSKDSRLFAEMTQVSYERSLAWTHNGYLALLPAAAKAGDMIAILKGGRLPFVLRSRGGPWELIGPCYVHGIMEGEAFDEDSCGDVRLV